MMFGDFASQFGLNFPTQGADSQGGLFGDNAPVAGQPPLGGPAAPSGAGTGSAIPNLAAPKGPAGPGSIQAPPSGQNVAGAGSPQAAPPTAAAAPSPLASPLAPGQAQPALAGAPAAGIGSQFRNSVLQ